MEKVSQMPLRRNFMNVRQLTIAGLLSAITVFLGATGYGFIPLLVVDATILHIPTIIAAITGGRRVGMTVGFMFGVFSFVQSLRAPSALMLLPYRRALSMMLSCALYRAFFWALRLTNCTCFSRSGDVLFGFVPWELP